LNEDMRQCHKVGLQAINANNDEEIIAVRPRQRNKAEAKATETNTI